MAGNKNPWRDIVTNVEWQVIRTRAAALVKDAAYSKQAPRKPLPVRGAPPQRSKRERLEQILGALTVQIMHYNAIGKDDYQLFRPRQGGLMLVRSLCQLYLTEMDGAFYAGVKGADKLKTDSIDVWITSIMRRAQKKADYLEKMYLWHLTAKEKYSESGELLKYLNALAADNTRNVGKELHATPYATLERNDPYHRQTVVVPDGAGGFEAHDKRDVMAKAFVAWLSKEPPRKKGKPDGSPYKPDATFYEWLEYTPFCIGTPGIHGSLEYKDPGMVNYDVPDLASVFVDQRLKMSYEIIGSGVTLVLDTTTFASSGKGPKGGAAFVWTRSGALLLHAHGQEGFVHASAQQGKRIRCSGMLRVVNGLVTDIDDNSGHYQPLERNIYNFIGWLKERGWLQPGSKVTTYQSTGPVGVPIFMQACKKKYGEPQIA